MKKILLVLLLLLPKLSLAQISFVNSADLGNNSNTGNFWTPSAYTVGSGVNRMLVVVAITDTIPPATDDLTVTNTTTSSDMTLGVKNTSVTSNRLLYVFYQLNPPSGANTLRFNNPSAVHYILALAADYAGVNQSGQPDATATNQNTTAGITSLTSSISTVAANSWVIIGEESDSPSAGSGDVLRVSGAAFSEPGLFDSNGALGAGSHNFTTATTAGTRGIGHALISFAPDGGGASGSASKSMLLGVGK